MADYVSVSTAPMNYPPPMGSSEKFHTPMDMLSNLIDQVTMRRDSAAKRAEQTRYDANRAEQELNELMAIQESLMSVRQRFSEDAKDTGERGRY